MKFLLISFLLINISLTVFCDVLNAEEEWVKFNRKFPKTSKRSTIELAKRKSIFEKNVEKINQHNSQNKGYTLGINEFSDWTEQEFNSMLRPMDMPEPEVNTFLKPLKPGQKLAMSERAGEEIPDSWDWRDHGKVTDVRTQSPCASCWAFGATAAIESLILIQYNQTYDLSEQHLVNCVGKEYGRDPVCEWGGWPAWAYKYIIDNGGYALEQQVPYIKASQECEKNENYRYADLSGFVAITPGDEEEMKRVLYLNGPISVDIDARGLAQMKDGIFQYDGCSTERGNHIVTIVGYGTNEQGVDYWVVKNSWGTSWGEEGFGKILRGVNMCAVAMHADYPVRYV